MERVGGIIRFTIDGAQYRAKGNFSYMIGNPKREAVVGSDCLSMPTSNIFMTTEQNSLLCDEISTYTVDSIVPLQIK